MRVPEVHWSEGMFLRPQHLQLFARQFNDLLADAWHRSQPFFWGLSRVEILEDQLESFTFAVRRFDGVFKDGTRAHLPINLEVSPREFRGALDASSGGLEVFLGVPMLREGETNVAQSDNKDARYLVERTEIVDENRRGASQAIETRKLNGRLFFGSENREDYESLPIARVRRASGGHNLPVLDPDYIPPVLNVRSWNRLSAIAESVLHRLEAKHRYLRSEMLQGEDLVEATAASVQSLFKLQSTASFSAVLRQLTSMSTVHPFLLYAEWMRLAGELSIFERENLEIPPYDHDDLGRSFGELEYTIGRLLDRVVGGAFELIRFDEDRSNEMHTASLPEYWGADGDLYLCVESKLATSDVASKLSTAKIGAPHGIEELRQRRTRGLDVRQIHAPPGGLPSRADLHYFTLDRQGEHWESVIRSRRLAISGTECDGLGLSLYIIGRNRADGPVRPVAGGD